MTALTNFIFGKKITLAGCPVDEAKNMLSASPSGTKTPQKRVLVESGNCIGRRGSSPGALSSVDSP